MECLLTFILLICYFTRTRTSEILLQQSGDGILGGRETKIICSFNATPHKVIFFTLLISARNSTTQIYDEIAGFQLNLPPVLRPGGMYLQGRVKLNSSLTSTSSGQASISFENLTCDDEKEYKCDLTIITSASATLLLSAASNISVQASPLQPETVSQLDLTETLEEGKEVAFKCDGNVGKPPGRYIWHKIRKNNSELTTYHNITTVTTTAPHTCTYNGTSFLTIQLTAEDDQAIMRCAEQSMSSLYKDTKHINVLYKVRKPAITKHPNQKYYLVGSGYIELKCHADGNPQSNYIWFKDDNANLTFSSNASIVIDSKYTTNSGAYECHAFNSLNGKIYYQFKSVDIFIVYEIPTSASSTVIIKAEDKAVSQQPWFWISMILIVVIILVSIAVVHLVRTRVPKEKKTSAYCDSQLQTLENHRYDIMMSSSNTLDNDGYEDTGILNPNHGVNTSDKTANAADENKTAISVTSSEEANFKSPYSDIDAISLPARKTYENTMI